MTGEMVKPEHADEHESFWKGKRGMWGNILGDPSYCIRPNYPEIFDVADTLKRKGIQANVQPFDTYQGPYVQVGAAVRAGQSPYALTTETGHARIWYHDEFPNTFVVERIGKPRSERYFMLDRSAVDTCHVENGTFICDEWEKIEVD